VATLQVQPRLAEASPDGVAVGFRGKLGANQLATKADGAHPDAGSLATRASGRVLIARERLTQRSVGPTERQDRLQPDRPFADGPMPGTAGARVGAGG